MEYLWYIPWSFNPTTKSIVFHTRFTKMPCAAVNSTPTNVGTNKNLILKNEMYALQNSSEKNKSESSMNPWLRTEFLSFFFFFPSSLFLHSNRSGHFTFKVWVYCRHHRPSPSTVNDARGDGKGLDLYCTIWPCFPSQALDLVGDCGQQPLGKEASQL